MSENTELPPTPPKRARRHVGGPELEPIRVRLQTTTPLLGGAPETRQVDSVDIIRAPTVRGHLRFWWRAVHGHLFDSPRQLAERERALWGGVGQTLGTRSQVELRVEVDRNTQVIDSSDIQPGAQGAYALWPARKPKAPKPAGQWKPGLNAELPKPADRCEPGLSFRLHLCVPASHVAEVRDALRAWIIWGGYGSRTRRGLGGLTVSDAHADWLPSNPSQDALRGLFHTSSFLETSAMGAPRPMPCLQGARLVHGKSPGKALDAWIQALNWLRDFRQKPGEGIAVPESSASRFARAKGSANRPGRSFWPEPDKIRLLQPRPGGGDWAHAPRAAYASRGMSWPRAGFGLPLAVHFQPKNAQNEFYPRGEPGDVELRWHDGAAVRERLASPLIVKAMPLANGTFVPIALWLRRAWPEGKVVLLRKGQRSYIPGSEAPFDLLLAPEDRPLLESLENHTRLEDAFLSWVKTQGATES